MGESELTALTQGIFELKIAVENMAEKQQEMNEDVKKIKEAIYNPDQGLYARIKALESWKDSSQKVLWLVATTVLCLATTTVYNFFIS